jgi:hypothetical protein
MPPSTTQHLTNLLTQERSTPQNTGGNMKRTTIIAALAIALTTPAISLAQSTSEEFDCFPACVAQAPAPTPAATATPSAENACANAATPSTTQQLVTQAEKLNEQIKPVKEIVGYVRAPQGLAIKLVNDHVVKIPAWVGYAVDPVGSIKNKAMKEVRSRAKDAIGLNRKADSCPAQAGEVDTNAVTLEPTLLPLDTDRI